MKKNENVYKCFKVYINVIASDRYLKKCFRMHNLFYIIMKHTFRYCYNVLMFKEYYKESEQI